MSQAARLNDRIGHSPSMNWLLTGLAAGAAIGVGAIAIVGTGGLAAAAVVGGLAAGGAGIGELFSTMSWAPKEICGVIKGECSGNVFTNGIQAARAHVDVVDCYKHSLPYPPIATGSATVFINGQPAARVNDKAGCSAVITSGSNNVYIGGGTMQTDVLEPEKLVPDAVHAGLLVVGIGSAIVLGGPIIATAGLFAGAVGQSGGEWVGGKAFGVGSDGQKWAMLGGALLGSIAGTKGAGLTTKKLAPQSALKTKGAAKGETHQTKDAANFSTYSGDVLAANFIGPLDQNSAAALKIGRVTAPIDFDGHIFAAEIKANGNVVGGHSIVTGNVQVIPGTATAPNAQGVYSAKIQVADPKNPGQFLPKTNNGGVSTLFPDSWSAARIKVEVDAAFQNKTIIGNKWTGTTPSGVRVEGYIKPKTTVYPKL
jgi:uncharacterized Zn-binding protein involved in type VI secretion